MDKTLPCFIDEKNNQHSYITIRNLNSKPMTFAWCTISTGYDSFNEDNEREILKTEIFCADPLKLFESIFNDDNISVSDTNFWCFKRKSKQLMGISFVEFKRLLSSLKGYDFVYPFMDDDYVILLCGKSMDAGSFRLIAYLTNRRYVYCDIIRRMRMQFQKWCSNVRIEPMGTIEIQDYCHKGFGKQKPTLRFTAGCTMMKTYQPFYFLIDRSWKSEYKLVNDLSHVLVIDNGTGIPFNNRFHYNLFQLRLIALDEINIISLKSSRLDYLKQKSITGKLFKQMRIKSSNGSKRAKNL